MDKNTITGYPILTVLLALAVIALVWQGIDWLTLDEPPLFTPEDDEWLNPTP